MLSVEFGRASFPKNCLHLSPFCLHLSLVCLRLSLMVIMSVICTTRPFTKKGKQGCRNGIIKASTHLSIILRYFAGGSVYTTQHSNHKRGFPYRSLPQCLESGPCDQSLQKLAINFPTCHYQQRCIARGFRDCSPQAKFGKCVGACFPPKLPRKTFRPTSGAVLWLPVHCVHKIDTRNIWLLCHGRSSDSNQEIIIEFYDR
jgi:hypothetical protein